MRNLCAILTALMITSLAPFAHADEGPFGGAIYQDDVLVHEFDNTGDLCVSTIVTYELLLEYGPETDTITLSAEGETDVGLDGKAYVEFEGDSCTKFEIVVEGTSIADVAEYQVTVTAV